MLRVVVLLSIVGLTAALTAAAIEFLPQTLYFPAVSYSTADGQQVQLLQAGRSDEPRCAQETRRLVQPIRRACPACTVAERCRRGLEVEQRRILSRAPLGTPSARTQDGALTMTFSAPDPKLALEACRQTEQLSAGNPAPRRVRCFPAGFPR